MGIVAVGMVQGKLKTKGGGSATTYRKTKPVVGKKKGPIKPKPSYVEGMIAEKAVQQQGGAALSLVSLPAPVKATLKLQKGSSKRPISKKKKAKAIARMNKKAG